MKFHDLLIMSINNLRRRKLRTVLTVLGVVIGTASIVVMVSLGIGLNELTTEQIASYGSLTTIEVYSESRWGHDSSSKTEPNYINDDVIKELQKLPHVKGVSPYLSVSVLMKQGVYQGYTELCGVNHMFMEEIPMGEGEIPSPKDTEMQMVVGNMVPTRFFNSKTGKGYWDNPDMDIDFMNKPMYVIYDTDAYYAAQSPSGEGNPVKAPKKYIVKTAGLVEGTMEDWNSYS